MIPLLKFVKTSKRKLNKRLQNISSVENKNGSATIPNAFASTFFFANTQGNAKKIKRACKPTHSDSADIRANLIQLTYGRKEERPIT